MADRMSAEIWIGGSIPESLVEEFCGVLRTESLSPDYGEASFEPQDAEELLDGTLKDSGLLRLCDDEVAYGEFDDLETWLQEHGIPYTRRSDGKYEHDPVVVEFRPNSGLHACTANKGLQAVVEVQPLRKVVRRLQAAMEASAKKKPKKARKQIKQALKLMTRHLPPDWPPLPPLEIVADAPGDNAMANGEAD
jgi:hypothetical protein